MQEQKEVDKMCKGGREREVDKSKWERRGIMVIATIEVQIRVKDITLFLK